MEIVEEADRNNVPVFMKDSLIPIVGDKNMRRDYPQGLKVQKISEKMHNKLYDICYRCGREMKKSDMIALLARSVRGEQPKQYGSCVTTVSGNTVRNMELRFLNLRKWRIT